MLFMFCMHALSHSLLVCKHYKQLVSVKAYVACNRVLKETLNGDAK